MEVQAYQFLNLYPFCHLRAKFNLPTEYLITIYLAYFRIDSTV